MNTSDEDKKPAANFIRHIIAEDLKSNKHGGQVVTRFPPEPNGYLHIGHAKTICLNFGLALENENGVCHLRFDDTNPEKEEMEFVESIQENVKWLGFDWEDKLFFASSYFEKLYDYAVQLIKLEKAYVCDLSFDEMKEYRGTLTKPGKESPYRNRSVEESLDLFQQMREGKFEDGSKVLRAKIDMSSSNVNMRDPVVYRIKRAHHPKTGDEWCIYPMYDFTHCLSDSLEGITHSICTLEFEDHRPLYDWFLDELKVDCHPQQIEFARLNLEYTVMSKRKILELVTQKYVAGWDDPRLPTLVGMKRRGYTPAAIRSFCEQVGVTKKDSMISMGTLESCLREDLDKNAKRAMAVLDPIKVVIENLPDDFKQTVEASAHPKNPEFGKRQMTFSKEIYIERDDFMEDPPKKFFRLAPGKEVRLRFAYVIKCNEVIKDEATGEVKELRCSYDPDTFGGKKPEGRKVKGIIHWVSAKDHIRAEVRVYDRLFAVENPDSASEGDYKDHLNPSSLVVKKDCYLEPCLKNAKSDESYQFERIGYFCLDSEDSKPDALVFNRTVTLKDTWAKVSK